MKALRARFLRGSDGAPLTCGVEDSLDIGREATPGGSRENGPSHDDSSPAKRDRKAVGSPASGEADLEATEKLRARLREERKNRAGI